MSFDVVGLGVRDGLVWLPLILGFGLLLTHLRHVDVSLDGVVVLSAISAAVTANATQSYVASFAVAMLAGACLSSVCALAYGVLGLPQLMVGVLFSLIAHSISVMWIGESVRISDTRLLVGNHIPAWLWLLAAVLLVGSWLCYRSKVGLLVRKLGDGVLVNTVVGPKVLFVTAYAFSGTLYGLGGALYAHKIGAARSGGGFEYLVVALSSFLCVRRVTELLAKLLMARRGFDQHGTPGWAANCSAIFRAPEVNAILGGAFYGIVVYVVLAVSPDPSSWKLVLATALLLALLDYRAVAFPRRHGGYSRSRARSRTLHISGLGFSYPDGQAKGPVFRSANAMIGTGLTVVAGTNGVGKSTLLRIIGGQLFQQHGSIALDAVRIDGMPAHRRGVFSVTQNPFETVGATLTVEEFLATAAALDSNPFRELRGTLGNRLTSLGFDAAFFKGRTLNPFEEEFWKQRVMHLSGGQATVVAFFGSVIANSSVVLLDEPTTGIDAEHFRLLSSLIRSAAVDRVIIAATHDARLTTLASSILHIRDGTIDTIASDIASDAQPCVLET